MTKFHFLKYFVFLSVIASCNLHSNSNSLRWWEQEYATMPPVNQSYASSVNQEVRAFPFKFKDMVLRFIGINKQYISGKVGPAEQELVNQQLPNPYRHIVQKKIISTPTSECITIAVVGDLHADIKALMEILTKLRSLGFLTDNFKGSRPSQLI